MTAPILDVIAIGRSSVDLYGQQIGGPLEDMATFAKSVGGSPTNTAIGAARLGLKSAVITAVGDEPFGRFIREQLVREGVAVAGVKTDPHRLTALVALGVRNDKSFPLIFYRENCADMALTVEDVDEAFIATAKAVCISGTHLSTATVYAMSRKAVAAAKAAGRRVAFDVDYRPNLWGLAGHGSGEERYIRSDTRDGAPADDRARLRPHRRHGRGAAHPRRIAGYPRGPARHPGAHVRDARLQARPDGLRRLSRRHSGSSRGRRDRPRLSGRGLQRARRRRRLHGRLPARLAA